MFPKIGHTTTQLESPMRLCKKHEDISLLSYRSIREDVANSSRKYS
jgi:hypothetical protein